MKYYCQYSLHAVPEAPADVVVEPTYNNKNLFLSRLEVQWGVQASDLVLNEIFLFHGLHRCQLSRVFWDNPRISPSITDPGSLTKVLLFD